jgi:hypothetical protein
MNKCYFFEIKNTEGYIWHGRVGEVHHAPDGSLIEIYVDNGVWSGTIDTNGILRVDFTNECFDLTTGEYTFDWHCKEDEPLGCPIVL